MATITTTVPITTSPSISISFAYLPPPSHPVAQVKTLGMGSVVPSSFKSRSPPSCRAKLGANPAIRSRRQQVQHQQTNHQQTNDDSAKFSIVIVLCQFWHDLSARLFNFSSSVSLWQRVRGWEHILSPTQFSNVPPFARSLSHCHPYCFFFVLVPLVLPIC